MSFCRTARLIRRVFGKTFRLKKILEKFRAFRQRFLSDDDTVALVFQDFISHQHLSHYFGCRA